LPAAADRVPALPTLGTPHAFPLSRRARLPVRESVEVTMHRLSGMDAMFLYNEVPTQHMHTLKLAILDVPDDYSFEEAMREFASRVHSVPPLRQRVVPTPLGLNHPLMIEDPDFDPELHFHRAALPTPGGPRELCAFISEIASRPLDRTRPLWELWMVEGLAGGRVACVMKVHHALADGVATADMLMRFMTTEPEEALPPEDRPWQPEAVPSRRRALWLALRDLVPFLIAAVPALWRAAAEARRLRALHADRPHGAHGFEAPDTSFNGLLTSHRRFVSATIPFEEFERVKRALGGTVNDVVLAMVSGALRRYLLERDELPDSSLIATVPVSTRKPEQQGTFGNRVAAMYIRLRTEMEDPLARFQAIREESAASKSDFADAPGAQLSDFLELMPPFVARLMFSRTTTLMKRLGRPSQANVIVSNVPGPRQELFENRFRLAAFYSIGPVLEGIGVNVTAWSYQGQLHLAVVTDRKMVPDPSVLIERLRDALAELIKLADERATSGSDAAGGEPHGG
jgi:WS/DGAT/MGAT family acyltransferase